MYLRDEVKANFLRKIVTYRLRFSNGPLSQNIIQGLVKIYGEVGYLIYLEVLTKLIFFNFF